MTLRTVTDCLRATVRDGLRPASPAAFLAAILFVAIATLVRLAIDFVAPNAVPFATYFPAVLVAALIGGVAAGLLATLLGGALSYWMFVPPRFALTHLGLDTCVNFALFLIASLTIVWIAAQYRRVVRKLGEEEHYRQVVVDELGHRVKNKLATIHAILRHELRGHDSIWDSVAGRLRALSVADDFLVSSDEGAVDLKQILTMELGPYGAANVAMRGEAIRLFAKLPAVLALVFHELATNAPSMARCRRLTAGSIFPGAKPATTSSSNGWSPAVPRFPVRRAAASATISSSAASTASVVRRKSISLQTAWFAASASRAARRRTRRSRTPTRPLPNRNLSVHRALCCAQNGSAFNVMNAWFEAARFGADIQNVIALRMLRLAGGGPLAATEARRMISEKVFAFGEAQVRILSSLASGQSVDVAKAYAPYRRRVRANRRRLGG